MREFASAVAFLVFAVGIALFAGEPEDVSAWVKKHGGQFRHHTADNGGPGYEIVLPQSLQESDWKDFLALKPTKTWDLNLRPCTKLPAASVRELKDLPALRTLWLPVATTDEEVKHVATALPHLTRLILQETKVTDAGLKPLARMTNLAHLHLGATAVSDNCWTELAAIPALESVSLSNNAAITGKGLEKLAAVRSLRKLDLSKTKVTDDTAGTIARLAGLRELSLRELPVTDQTAKALSGLTELRELNIAYTQITDAAIADLARLKNLETINVDGTKMTTSGVKELKKALPNCRVLR